METARMICWSERRAAKCGLLATSVHPFSQSLTGTFQSELETKRSTSDRKLESQSPISMATVVGIYWSAATTVWFAFFKRLIPIQLLAAGSRESIETGRFGSI
jgi:hypothetical protein